MMKAVIAGACAAVFVSACALSPSPRDAEAGAMSRVRADFGAPLSADGGWAAGPGAAAVIDADSPFRLRMGARATGAPQQFGLEVRRNGGAWRAVDAHDFPLPERELAFDFAEAEPGAAPADWRAQAGMSLETVRHGAETVLSVRAGDEAGIALISPPWPLEAFSVTLDLRMPGDLADAPALVFGYEGPDDHARLEVDARQVRLVRIDSGARRVLAQTQAPALDGGALLLEVERENGRLRVEIGDGAARLETAYPGGLASGDVGLAVAPGGQALVRGGEIAGQARTPRVSVVSAGYPHGSATAPLLGGDAPGLAVSLRAETPAWTAAPGAVGEFVWPLVIRRFADGAVTNEAGDVFELRMVDADGAPVSGAPPAMVRLAIPEGHLGGTFVETPGRIGPWRTSNGDLYFIMEPAETDNLFMIVKSSDGGRTWREVDGANRPATGDLEAVDARRVGDTLHIVHQITEQVLHHAFNLATHDDAPDQWAFTDAPVAETEAVSQMATLAARPDGSLVTVFLGDRLYYAERPAGGAWSPMRPLDPEAGAMTVGPQAIAAEDGAVHIAYADGGGALWLRTLTPDGALSPRLQLATGAVTGEDDYGAILPLVRLEQRETLVIAYRLADGSLWERRVLNGALSSPVQITAGPVITNAVDSQQPAADIVANGADLHVLYVDEATRGIYAVHDCGEGWSAPVLQVGAVNGSWVRGAVHPGAEGAPVYGYVYDAGSNGGAGLNRYEAMALRACR
ncbi:MAG: hypothetical protein RIA71_07615 [Oceanicaulis sp.]